jgi:hypothetical protein
MRRRERGDLGVRKKHDKTDPGRFLSIFYLSRCNGGAGLTRYLSTPLFVCSLRSNRGVESRNRLDEEDQDYREPHIRSAETMKRKAALYERLGENGRIHTPPCFILPSLFTPSTEGCLFFALSNIFNN